MPRLRRKRLLRAKMGLRPDITKGVILDPQQLALGDDLPLFRELLGTVAVHTRPGVPA